MTEMVRVIPGYEHYEVSSEGGSDHWPASSIRATAAPVITTARFWRRSPIPKPVNLGVDLYRDGQGATPVRRAQMPIGLFSSGERQPIGRNSGADGRSR
jgi:hypothetical protein